MLNSYKIEDNGIPANAVDVNRGASYKYGTVNQRKLYSPEITAFRTRLNNRLLSALPDEELNRLMPFLQPVSVACGENIFHPNDVGEFLYLPETAVFSQLNILEDGRTIETAMIGNEGIAGIPSILSFRASPHWTQTSAAGSAFRISVEMFKQIFNQSDFLRSVVFSYLNSYITQISQRVTCCSHHCIEERFSTWLLMLADRSDEEKLFLTHDQISCFLGVHRPSITCIAQYLRHSEIIDYVRGKISILDRQKLKNLACECYSMIN